MIGYDSPRYGEILYRAPPELRGYYRRLESLKKKQVSLKWSITFNSICLKEKIWPTYTKIRHHDPALNNANSTRMYQQSLIERELQKIYKVLSKVECSIKDAVRSVQEFVGSDELKEAISGQLELIINNSDKIQK